MTMLATVNYDALVLTYIAVLQLDGLDASCVACGDLEAGGAGHDFLVEFGQIFCKTHKVHDCGFGCLKQLFKGVIGVRIHNEPPI